MTDKAKRCIEFVLRCEGGFVNNPNDPGGATNYGISQRAYPDRKIQALTREDAIAIYHEDYWSKLEADSFQEPLALAMMDAAVHHGVGFCTQKMNLIAGMAKHDGLAVTAILQDERRRGATTVAVDLIRQRAQLLASLGCSKGKEEFLPGWMRRIRDNLLAVRAFDKPDEEGG